MMDEELAAPQLPKLSKKEREQKNKEPIQIVKKDFKAGDIAILKNTQQKGTIKEINGNKVSVLVGNFVITTKLAEIE